MSDTATPEAPLTLDEIVAALAHTPNAFPAAAVTEAIRRRDEVVPRLMAMLREVLDDPEARCEDRDNVGHILAAVLLCHLREEQAHEPLIALFSLDPDLLDGLWGDMVTETLPGLLLGTCGGSTGRIQALAANDSVFLFTRWAAFEALAMAVVAGIADRDETLAFVAAQLRSAIDRDDYELGDIAACTLYELWPGGHIELLREAFEAEVCDPGTVSWRSIEASKAAGLERAMERLQRRLDRALPGDPHNYVSWMPCFRPVRKRRPKPGPRPRPVVLSETAQRAVQAQKKRKKQRRKRR